jgi:hypothetical protein
MIDNYSKNENNIALFYVKQPLLAHYREKGCFPATKTTPVGIAGSVSYCTW